MIKSPETKKKKNIFLIIILLLVALVILALAGAFAYLAYDHYHISELRAANMPEEKYSGSITYGSNEVELLLDESELYYLEEDYGLVGDIQLNGLKVRDYAFEIQEDHLLLYADMLAAGFLPLPIKAETELSDVSSGKLRIDVLRVHLGNRIEIPMHLLAKYGVQNSYTADLKNLDENVEFKSVSLKGGQVAVTAELNRDYTQHISPDQTADTLLWYGVEATPMIEAAAACYHQDMLNDTNQAVLAAIAASTDPFDTITHLLALSAKDAGRRYVDNLSAFEQRYIIPVSIEEIESLYDEYRRPIAEQNRNMQQLLDTLRTKYRDLEIKLTKKGYTDVLTGEALSLSALCPGLNIDDSTCQPLLLMATEPMKAPFTAGMPVLREVPKEKGLRLKDTLDYLPYDIGLIVTMPDGSSALLYYFSTGEMVVQSLPAKTARDIFSKYSAPKVMNLDQAVFGIKRTVQAPLSPDLASYILYTPYEVETVYAAK